MSRLVATLVYSKRVGSMARKAVLAYCADRASDDGTGIWCSKVRIAEEVECSKQTVIDTLRALVAEGLMSEVGRRKCVSGFTVEYALNLSAIRALPDVREGESGPNLDPMGSTSGPVQILTGQATGPHGVNQLDPNRPRTVLREERSLSPPPPAPSPAREPVVVADADAITLTDQIADALGADPSKHPHWATGALVVARWIAAGVKPATAIAAAKAERIRRDGKGHAPPNGPAYLEQAVMRLHAEAAAPVARIAPPKPQAPTRSRAGPGLTPEEQAIRDRLAGGYR
jgi:hypothetical protein